MTYLARGALAGVLATMLAGCGGTNSPLLGTGTSPRIRALNLLSSTVTADYDNNSNLIGTVPTTGISNYQSESEGNNTVIFNVSGSAVTSLNSVFQFGNFYTVVAYSKSGQDETFSVVDNNIALNNGTTQIRAVHANTGQSGSVDVYLQAGSTSSPSLVPANLISANGGLAFGTATAYAAGTPGQYTITFTPSGNTSTILLSTTVSVTGGQSISVYGLASNTQVTTVDDEGG